MRRLGLSCRMGLIFDSFWRAALYCLHPRVILLSLLPLGIMVALAFAAGYWYWEPAVAAVTAWLESNALLSVALGWLDSVGLAALRGVIGPLMVLFIATPVIVIIALLLVALMMTPAMVDLIRQGETAIAAQFLPDPRESITTPDESPDPIGDHTHSPLKGLVHRYPDRVLLKVLHACPVYCRFCFRREMVGPDGDGTLSETELDQAFAYIAATPAIFEVILTGGDPLMLSARR